MIMARVMMLVLLMLICIISFRAARVNGDTNLTEVSALKDLFNSITSRDKLTNWNLSSNNPCEESWLGVICVGSSVKELKLSGIGLTGSMGYQLSSLTALTNLDLSNNHFEGSIPYSLPLNALQINLGGNSFTGNLPYFSTIMSSLQYLNVSHNQLQGQLGDIFQNLKSLTVLDLSYNALTGSLPGSFISLSKINSMFLENNQFSGTIDVLANLSLENLNVASNQFTGWVPKQLENINLQKDNNPWNMGPAPPAPANSVPYNNNGNRNHKQGRFQEPSGNGSSKSGMSGGGIAAIVVSVLVVGAVASFFLLKRRSTSASNIEKGDIEHFAPLASNEVQEMKSIKALSDSKTRTYETSAPINLRPPPIDECHKSFDDVKSTQKPIIVKKVNLPPIGATSYSVADLQMATNSFSVDNLIGEGSIGRVYRAQFDDDKVLAVKKVDTSNLPNQSSDDFLEIVASISLLRHPNITKLAGYCSEHGQHLLVYEFHKNGSLHDFLHLPDEYSKPLTWNSRVRIALGTARALEYLHEVCSPSVVHKNFKSANILLDIELNPHLSDCGLSAFVPNAERTLNHSTVSGYSAPEVVMSGQYTLKSDVYSFGVGMLELLTGRKPFDSSRPRSEQSLVGWATPQLHVIDALAKMVDPALEGLYPVKSLSRFADVIALCVQSEPEFRPPMSEVVQALVRLVQRTNMSKRTVGNEKRAFERVDSFDD